MTIPIPPDLVARLDQDLQDAQRDIDELVAQARALLDTHHGDTVRATIALAVRVLDLRPEVLPNFIAMAAIRLARRPDTRELDRETL